MDNYAITLRICLEHIREWISTGGFISNIQYDNQSLINMIDSAVSDVIVGELTNNEWVEIYHALSTKVGLMEEKQNIWDSEDATWKSRLQGIMAKIGADGYRMWKEPEPWWEPWDISRIFKEMLSLLIEDRELTVNGS